MEFYSPDKKANIPVRDVAGRLGTISSHMSLTTCPVCSTLRQGADGSADTFISLWTFIDVTAVSPTSLVNEIFVDWNC